MVSGNYHAMSRPTSRTHRLVAVVYEQRHYLSSTSGKQEADSSSSGGWFTNWAENRTKKMFRQHMEDIANVETYTLGDYHDGLIKQLNSWSANLSGLFGASEVKHAKASVKLMETLIPTLPNGRNANFKELEQLTQLQKLKLATESDMTLERFTMELEAIKMSAMTHRLLQHLKKLGKPIPEEPDQLKTLLQAHARQILTPQEWGELKAMYKAMAKEQSQAPGPIRGIKGK